MRNRSVTQVLPSAAGQSVDVKQMLVEGNLDGVSGQKCSGARQTVMKQESPVIIFDLTAGVSKGCPEELRSKRDDCYGKNCEFPVKIIQDLG